MILNIFTCDLMLVLSSKFFPASEKLDVILSAKTDYKLRLLSAESFSNVFSAVKVFRWRVVKANNGTLSS